MALEAAAQLLTTALLLMQSVAANPALPESARAQASAVAQQAISAATRAVAKPGEGTAPWCRITSDKYNYALGEVVVFDYWTGTNAKSLEFVPGVPEKGWFPVPNGELLSTRGQYRKTVDVMGYPFIVMKATGKDGKSTTCSAMVHVGEV